MLPQLVYNVKEYEQALAPVLKLNIDENGNPKDIHAWDIERIASLYASSFMTGHAFMYGGNPADFATVILGMLNNQKSMWNLYPLK